MTTLFSIESLMKIIALGFVINGPKSYMRDMWNVLDFIIVVSSLISLSPDIIGDVSFFKAFRFVRILRPLRSIKRHKGLKLSVVSLINSVPGIARLFMVVTFFIFIIAILMTTIFSGTFFRCKFSEDILLSYKERTYLIQDKWDCINYGGEWVVPDMNFDNILNSVITLIIIQFREGWITVMWDSVDSKGVNEMPVQDNSRVVILLFIFIIILLCLLFVNLFVAIVIETFSKEKQFMNPFLETEQRKWFLLQIETYRLEPIVKLFYSDNLPLREKAKMFINSKKFENGITVAIILNTCVLAYSHFMMSDGE